MGEERRRRRAEELAREREEARREVERAMAVRERFERELAELIAELHALAAHGREGAGDGGHERC